MRCAFSTTPASPETYSLSLHDALPIYEDLGRRGSFHERRERVDQGCPGSRCDRHAHGIPTSGGICVGGVRRRPVSERSPISGPRSEEHTSELQSLAYLVCRLLLEKKNQ